MPDDIPIHDATFTPPKPVPPPKPVEAAIWHVGVWFVFRVEGAYMLYRRVPFRVRDAHTKRIQTLHHDIIAQCPVASAYASGTGIEPATLADAIAAAHFHQQGLT